LLASNLEQAQWNPAKIVAIYKRRMQIEEDFRDVKSEHLGLGLNLHRSHCPRRIEALLLIAALANYLIFLTGLQARESKLEQRYQSNSLKDRRVLSLWRLGLEYWRCCTDFGGREHLEKLEQALRDEMHYQAQSLE
jgi:transposase